MILTASRRVMPTTWRRSAITRRFSSSRLKLGQILGERGLHAWHRLEGEPGSAGADPGAGDLSGCGAGVPDSAACAAAEGAQSPLPLLYFVAVGLGLHSGGDCFYPALRAFSRTPDLCADRSDLSADAVERRRKPVLAPLASPHTKWPGCRSRWWSPRFWWMYFFCPVGWRHGWDWDSTREFL